MLAGNNNSLTAEQYLKQHNIAQLMQSIYYKLITEQPANPADYIKNNIHTIAAAPTASGQPNAHYTVAELQLLYTMLDPLNRGSINRQSVLIGLNELGVRDVQIDDAQYRQEQFVALCQQHLTPVH